MGDEIRISDEAISAQTSLLGQGVGDYCAFGLLSLGASAPVSGSNLHDGALTSALRNALLSFANVAESDASAVRGIGAEIKSADVQVASSISGG